jgi:hypothetical protein
MRFGHRYRDKTQLGCAFVDSLIAGSHHRPRYAEALTLIAALPERGRADRILSIPAGNYRNRVRLPRQAAWRAGLGWRARPRRGHRWRGGVSE